MRSFYFPFFSLNLEMWKITSGIREMIPFGGESLRKGLFPAKKMTQVFHISISAGTVRKESFSLTGTHVYPPTCQYTAAGCSPISAARLLTDTELAPNSNLSPIRYFRSFLKWILLAFIVSGYLVLLCQKFSFESVWGFVCFPEIVEKYWAFWLSFYTSF